MKSLLRSPIAALIVMALIATALRCGYAFARLPVSSPAEYILGLCWGVPVVIWMNYDAVRRRSRPCFDFGLFLIYAFPLSMLWYCFWSRGLARHAVTAGARQSADFPASVRGDRLGGRPWLKEAELGDEKNRARQLPSRWSPEAASRSQGTDSRFLTCQLAEFVQSRKNSHDIRATLTKSMGGVG